MIEACIFDLDGTLLDTEVLWVEATEVLLREWGHDISHDQMMDIVYGKSWLDVFESLRRTYGPLRLSREEMSDELSVRMRELRQERDVVIKGSLELFHQLSCRVPVCIVSGSPRADVETAVDLLGVRAVLAFCLGAEDYSPGKPNPTCFLKAAEMLGVAPEHCVVFEDSLAGISAGKAAGMKCVGLARPGAPKQNLSHADIILSDLSHFTMTDLG